MAHHTVFVMYLQHEYQTGLLFAAASLLVLVFCLSEQANAHHAAAGLVLVCWDLCIACPHRVYEYCLFFQRAL